MSNSSYDATHLVDMMHNVLHLDPNTFERVSNTFAIYADDLDLNENDYAQSLLTIPIILMCVGLLMVCCFECFICWRPCCKGCRANFHEDELEYSENTMAGNDQPSSQQNTVHHQSEGKERFIPKIRRLHFTFYFFAIAAIITNQVLIFGSVELTNGVQTGQDGIEHVEIVFTDLNDYGDELLEEGDIVQNDFLLATTDCPQAQPLYDNMEVYFTYVNEYIDYVEPMPAQCSSAHDNLQKWGIDYSNNAIWQFYVFIMVILGIYFLGLWCKQKCVLQVFIHFTALVLALLFLLCAVEMVLLVGLADFCADPSVNLLKVVPSDVYNVTEYYTTCEGTNPLAYSLSGAQELIDTSVDGINQLLDFPCAGNQYLEDALYDIGAIDYTLDNITYTIQCPPTQEELQSTINTGLCDETYRGIWQIWISQYLTATFLLFATIVICVAYQYFGQHSESKSPRSVSDANNVNHDSAVMINYQQQGSAPPAPDNQQQQQQQPLATKDQQPLNSSSYRQPDPAAVDNQAPPSDPILYVAQEP